MSGADWRSGGPWRAGDDGPADRDRPDDYEPPSRRGAWVGDERTNQWHAPLGTPLPTLADMVPDGLAVDVKKPCPMRCQAGTGWTYCDHADGSLTPCDCSCKCVDQDHCPLAPT